MVDRDVSSELDSDLERAKTWKKDDNDKKNCFTDQMVPSRTQNPATHHS